MKLSLKQSTRSTRRWLLGALGGISLLATGAQGLARAAARKPAAPARLACVECLVKRARQRTAFVNKWV